MTCKQTKRFNKFKLLLLEKTFIMSGQYVNITTNVEFSCQVCDNIWVASPANITKGTGCPACAKIKQNESIRVGEDDFLKSIQGTNISLLSGYNKLGAAALFSCDNCCHQWTTWPFYIKNGAKCPNCNPRKRGHPKAQTTEEFVATIFGRGITVLGEYKNTRTKIKLSCDACNTVWESYPGYIKDGAGCPRCKTHKTTLNRFKNIKTSLYLIHITSHCGIPISLLKPGITSKTISERYKNDAITYEIIAEIKFEDGSIAASHEQKILFDTREFKPDKCSVLYAGNSELRTYMANDILYEYFNKELR